MALKGNHQPVAPFRFIDRNCSTDTGFMFLDWNHMHRQFLSDLGHICRDQADEMQIIRQGFCFTLRSWYGIRRKWEEAGEIAKDEEIFFFKECKPLITRWMDFYLLCYQGLLFVPGDRSGAIAFWNAEVQRAARFRQQHPEFVAYIANNCTHQDASWFVRAARIDSTGRPDRLFLDEQCRSSHDGLLRTLMAWDLYLPWVEQKLLLLRS